MKKDGWKSFLKGNPLRKRIFFFLFKNALASIPVIGPIFAMVDELVISNVDKANLDAINELVEKMYKQFGPLVEELEEKQLSDEDLLTYIKKRAVLAKINDFTESVEQDRELYEPLCNDIKSKIKGLDEKVHLLSEKIDDLSSDFNVGKQFKHISDSIKLRLSLFGSIDYFYKDLELISDAGEAKVYRAKRKDYNVNQSVVIKVLENVKEKDLKLVYRFLLEGFLASQLNHFNIVYIYNFGGFIKENQFYIEMEDLGDVNLKKWSIQNPLKHESVLEKYLNIFSQILDALKYLNQEGLIHRDIKPSNIMISNQMVKIIDFGCIKSLEMNEHLVLGQTLTANNEFIGTPQYMSPEQFDRNFAEISTASDIYSFGISMYELFTKNTF